MCEPSLLSNAARDFVFSEVSFAVLHTKLAGAFFQNINSESRENEKNFFHRSSTLRAFLKEQIELHVPLVPDFAVK